MSSRTSGVGGAGGSNPYRTNGQDEAGPSTPPRPTTPQIAREIAGLSPREQAQRLAGEPAPRRQRILSEVNASAEYQGRIARLRNEIYNTTDRAMLNDRTAKVRDPQNPLLLNEHDQRELLIACVDRQQIWPAQLSLRPQAMFPY